MSTTTKTSRAYVESLEKRHNLPAHVRSCGDHCPLPFEVTDVGAGQTVRVGIGDSGEKAKGQGVKSLSNRGPSNRGPDPTD